MEQEGVVGDEAVTATETVSLSASSWLLEMKLAPFWHPSPLRVSESFPRGGKRGPLPFSTSLAWGTEGVWTASAGVRNHELSLLNEPPSWSLATELLLQEVTSGAAQTCLN